MHGRWSLPEQAVLLDEPLQGEHFNAGAEGMPTALKMQTIRCNDVEVEANVVGTNLLGSHVGSDKDCSLGGQFEQGTYANMLFQKTIFFSYKPLPITLF